jgi:hypothetical protein
MPRLIQFRKKDGVLHVPVSDIAGVERRDDGTGVVTFKNGLDAITIKRADAVIDALRGPETPAPAASPVTSIFEQIFGKL